MVRGTRDPAVCLRTEVRATEPNFPAKVRVCAAHLVDRPASEGGRQAFSTARRTQVRVMPAEAPDVRRWRLIASYQSVASACRTQKRWVAELRFQGTCSRN